MSLYVEVVPLNCRGGWTRWPLKVTSNPNFSVTLIFQIQKNGVITVSLIPVLCFASSQFNGFILPLLFQHHLLLLILVYIFILLIHQKSIIVFWNTHCLIEKSIINRLFYLTICNPKVVCISIGWKALLKHLPAEMCYFLPLTFEGLNKQ